MSGFRIWIKFTNCSRDMVCIIIIHDVDKILHFQSLKQTNLKQLSSTQPSNFGTHCPSKYENLKFISCDNFLWHRIFITFSFAVFILNWLLYFIIFVIDKLNIIWFFVILYLIISNWSMLKFYSDTVINLLRDPKEHRLLIK